MHLLIVRSLCPIFFSGVVFLSSSCRSLKKKTAIASKELQSKKSLETLNGIRKGARRPRNIHCHKSGECIVPGTHFPVFSSRFSYLALIDANNKVRKIKIGDYFIFKEVHQIIRFDGSIFVFGSHVRGFYLLKLSNQFKKLWIKVYENLHEIKTVRILNEVMLITGPSREFEPKGFLETEPTLKAVHLLSLAINTNGEIIWQTRIEAPWSPWFGYVRQVDKIIFGIGAVKKRHYSNVLFSINNGGFPNWSKSLNLGHIHRADLLKVPDGWLIVFNKGNSKFGGDYKKTWLGLLMINSKGNIVWAKRYVEKNGYNKIRPRLVRKSSALVSIVFENYRGLVKLNVSETGIIHSKEEVAFYDPYTSLIQIRPDGSAFIIGVNNTFLERFKPVKNDFWSKPISIKAFDIKIKVYKDDDSVTEMENSKKIEIIDGVF